MTDPGIPARYGKTRIRRGLLHFLFGKGISSVAGFAYLVLLVRHLSVAEFATYSVLQAFIEVFTAVTGFGLTHAALRYVPELYARHENRVLRILVPSVFGLRLVLLSLAVFLVLYVADAVAPAFGLQDWIFAFQAYLLVVWLRVNSHFLFQLLESTLHQGIGQSAMSISVLAKLAGLGWLMQQGQVDILAVIRVEIFAEGLGLALLLFGLMFVLADARPADGMQSARDWWKSHAPRVVRYSLTGYAQYLAILPYGSTPNRLLAGRFLDVGSTAAFGFAQSFADLFRRYLPAQLLGGLIRPVLIAQYSSSHDFSRIAEMVSFVFRANTLLLAGGICLLVVSGPELLSLISKGKYGVEASWVLSALLVVLILESRRFLVDIAIQAVEKNQLLIVGNALLATSLLITVISIPLFGVMIIPTAAAVALLVSNRWMSARLKRDGFVFLKEQRFLGWLATIMTLVIGGGLLMKNLFSPLLAAVLTGAGYLVLIWFAKVIEEKDIEMVRSILRRKRDAPEGNA